MVDGRGSIGGLVLADGAGRRFGGGKLVVELDGRPLLGRALEAMLGVPAIERVVVVWGANADEVAARVELTRVETLVCKGWQRRSDALPPGLEALAECEAIVVTLGDQPFITPQAIAAITDQLGTPEAAARATYDGRPDHPVLISDGSSTPSARYVATPACVTSSPRRVCERWSAVHTVTAARGAAHPSAVHQPFTAGSPCQLPTAPPDPITG